METNISTKQEGQYVDCFLTRSHSYAGEPPGYQ